MNDKPTQRRLQKALQELASIEERDSPFGVSFCVRGQESVVNSPDLGEPKIENGADTAETVLEIVKRSRELINNRENIPFA